MVQVERGLAKPLLSVSKNLRDPPARRSPAAGDAPTERSARLSGWGAAAPFAERGRSGSRVRASAGPRGALPRPSRSCAGRGRTPRRQTPARPLRARGRPRGPRALRPRTPGRPGAGGAEQGPASVRGAGGGRAGPRQAAAGGAGRPSPAGAEALRWRRDCFPPPRCRAGRPAVQAARQGLGHRKNARASEKTNKQTERSKAEAAGRSSFTHQASNTPAGRSAEPRQREAPRGLLFAGPGRCRAAAVPSRELGGPLRGGRLQPSPPSSGFAFGVPAAATARTAQRVVPERLPPPSPAAEPVAPRRCSPDPFLARSWLDPGPRAHPPSRAAAAGPGLGAAERGTSRECLCGSEPRSPRSRRPRPQPAPGAARPYPRTPPRRAGPAGANEGPGAAGGKAGRSPCPAATRGGGEAQPRAATVREGERG